MSGPAEDEYQKLTAAVDEELKRIYDGHRAECIEWLGRKSAFWVRMISYLMTEMAQGVANGLPVPLFAALQSMFLDANRVAYEMWKNRDWFELQSRPLPPGIH
jgi:hypothetical protein